ncbi:MAG TPA: ABC transporter permease [Candidatus Binataceae bacterium]|nr:ABC transporter permease [Candidatus Binataceae bacterium]
MRYELKIALRYLRARRKDAFISITTIFTAVGVMIGVAALTITLAVMGGFEQSLKQRVLSLTPQVKIESTEGSIAQYAEIEARARTVAGVDGADAYVVGQGMLSSGRGIGGVVVRGVEPNNPVVGKEWGRFVVQGALAGLAKDTPIAAQDGAQPAMGGGLAIGSGLARTLKVKLGDRLRMVAPIIAAADGSLSTKTGDFTVAAIFDSGLSFLDTQMVFMDLAHAQSFFGRPGKADGIDIHLSNLDQTAAVTAALRRIYGRPYLIRNWIEYNESASAGFEMLKRVYAIVLVLLIGVAAFNLVATLIMVVMEKRKDIAVLISMGAQRRDVQRIFRLKGLIVGAAGTGAGLLLGAIGCFLLARYHFIHISKEIYGISTVPISASPINFAWVAVASMLLCFVATLYPARQASREMPVEVFRS